MTVMGGIAWAGALLLLSVACGGSSSTDPVGLGGQAGASGTSGSGGMVDADSDATGCPGEKPQWKQPCIEVQKGTDCTYGSIKCTCVPSVGDTALWICDDGPPQQCPTSAPPDGEWCTEVDPGTVCVYAETTCTCTSISNKPFWLCGGKP